jgi:Na+/melibiose symporter-like transporter
MPMMIAAGVVSTFLRNRVQFSASKLLPVDAQTELEAHEISVPEEAPKLSLKESFMVIKHNKFMLYSTAANIITQLSPHVDDYPLKRWLFPERRILGRGSPVRGEGYLQLSKQLSGFPITILYPFLGAIMKKVGGPKRAMILDILLRMASFLLRYFAGYKSVFGLVMYILADTIFMTSEPLGFYADHVLNYEMLDYVEWKTGVRSEGITMAFKTFTNKIVANNINSFTGNAFASWTGIHKIDINDPNLVLPERYVKWVWPMVNLMPVIDCAIFLVARIAFPYKVGQKDVIEAGLKERRELAAKVKEEMEIES